MKLAGVTVLSEPVCHFEARRRGTSVLVRMSNQFSDEPSPRSRLHCCLVLDSHKGFLRALGVEAVMSDKYTLGPRHQVCSRLVMTHGFTSLQVECLQEWQIFYCDVDYEPAREDLVVSMSVASW